MAHPAREAPAEQPDPERALAVHDGREGRVDRQPLAAPDQPPRLAVPGSETLHRGDEDLAPVVETQAPDLARFGKALVRPFEALRSPGQNEEALDRADPEAARRVGPHLVEGLVGREPAGPPELHDAARFLAVQQTVA